MAIDLKATHENAVKHARAWADSDYSQEVMFGGTGKDSADVAAEMLTTLVTTTSQLLNTDDIDAEAAQSSATLAEKLHGNIQRQRQSNTFAFWRAASIEVELSKLQHRLTTTETNIDAIVTSLADPAEGTMN